MCERGRVGMEERGRKGGKGEEGGEERGREGIP